jgi:hypothetical protein
MSFKVNEQALWWCPKPQTAIDPRELALLGVVGGPESFTLHVYLTGSDDKREFHYVSLEDLNAVLQPLGLQWEPADA